jgi:hypothetical protein
VNVPVGPLATMVAIRTMTADSRATILAPRCSLRSVDVWPETQPPMEPAVSLWTDQARCFQVLDVRTDAAWVVWRPRSHEATSTHAMVDRYTE